MKRLTLKERVERLEGQVLKVKPKSVVPSVLLGKYKIKKEVEKVEKKPVLKELNE